MYNFGVALQVLTEGQKPPVGLPKFTRHLIWDMNVEFTPKLIWVLDGHKKHNPIVSTYSGLVSRESVRIAFTYSALTRIEVCAADNSNAYIQVPSSQKDYIVCSTEFGIENVVKHALFWRALYGGKSARKDFQNRLRSCIRRLDFASCPANPDVWKRPAKHSNGTYHYEFILLYTENALVISENSNNVLCKNLGRYFELKVKSIGPPKYISWRIYKTSRTRK